MAKNQEKSRTAIFRDANIRETSSNVLRDVVDLPSRVPRCDINVMTDRSLSLTPVVKLTKLTPMAPVKQRRQIDRKTLTPKKLVYSDDETENIVPGRNSCKETRSAESTRERGKVNEWAEPTPKRNAAEKKSSSNRRSERITAKPSNGRKCDTDKENDAKLVSSTNKKRLAISSCQSNRSSGVRECATRREVSPLSDEMVDWMRQLQLLQLERAVGLWVQCNDPQCRKWRFLDDTHDPLDLPKTWFCRMKPDTTCRTLERPPSPAQERDLIENKYNAGSIVWARIRGYPWWPAMVDDNPNTMQYYELRKKSKIPIKYNVVFFYEVIQIAWVSCRDLKPYIGNDRAQFVKKTTYHGVDYKEQLDAACRQAFRAISLSVLQRLQTFSYVSRFKQSTSCADRTKIDDNGTKLKRLNEIEVVPGSSFKADGELLDKSVPINSSNETETTATVSSTASYSVKSSSHQNESSEQTVEIQSDDEIIPSSQPASPQIGRSKYLARGALGRNVKSFNTETRGKVVRTQSTEMSSRERDLGLNKFRLFFERGLEAMKRQLAGGENLQSSCSSDPREDAGAATRSKNCQAETARNLLRESQVEITDDESISTFQSDSTVIEEMHSQLEQFFNKQRDAERLRSPSESQYAIANFTAGRKRSPDRESGKLLAPSEKIRKSR